MKTEKNFKNFISSKSKSMSQSEVSDLVSKIYIGKMLFGLKVLHAFAIVCIGVLVIMGCCWILNFIYESMTSIWKF